MKNLETVIEEVLPFKQEGYNVELILEILKKKEIPANFSAIVVAKLFELDLKEANKLVLTSKVFGNLGEISDGFLDIITKG